MLFYITADYTPQSLKAMRENPKTDRQAAIEEFVSAAGGKIIGMWGKSANGPGVMMVFEVSDPDMAPAMTGVAVSAGALQNVELTRLFTMDEVSNIRQKSKDLQGAYKPPGQK